MPFVDEYPSLSNGALEIDPYEFAEAFRLMSRVYAGTEGFTPQYQEISVLNDRGEIEPVQLEDSALNRVLLALKDWYHEEPVDKYISLCWRLFCLSKLIREGVLDEWIRTEGPDGSTHISGVVIQTAALLPLESITGYDEDLFLWAIKQNKDN